MLQELQRQRTAVTLFVITAALASQLVPRMSCVPVLVGIVARAVNFEYHLASTLATGRRTTAATITRRTATKGA